MVNKIKVICTGCSSTLSAPPIAVGKRIRCPRCQTVILVLEEPRQKVASDDVIAPDFSETPEFPETDRSDRTFGSRDFIDARDGDNAGHPIPNWAAAESRRLPPPLPPQPVCKTGTGNAPLRGQLGQTQDLPHHQATVKYGSLHRQRLFLVVASSLGMLSTFLPWVHVPMIGAVSGASGDGWLTLPLFLPAIVLSLRGQKHIPLVGGLRLGAVIPSAIAGLMGVIKIVRLNTLQNSGAENNVFAEMMISSVRVGVGLYLLVAAALAIGVAAWLLATPTETLRK